MCEEKKRYVRKQGLFKIIGTVPFSAPRVLMYFSQDEEEKAILYYHLIKNSYPYINSSDYTVKLEFEENWNQDTLLLSFWTSDFCIKYGDIRNASNPTLLTLEELQELNLKDNTLEYFLPTYGTTNSLFKLYVQRQDELHYYTVFTTHLDTLRNFLENWEGSGIAVENYFSGAGVSE